MIQYSPLIPYRPRTGHTYGQCVTLAFCAVSELQIKSTTTFVTCTRTNCYKKRTLSTMARTVSEQKRVRLRDPPGLLRIRSFVSGHRSYLKRGRLTPVSLSRTLTSDPPLWCARPSTRGMLLIVACGMFPRFRVSAANAAGVEDSLGRQN
eukprot:COSAG05_NODE_2266_length_3307_cov_2.517768_4_plen_150_part_00